MIGQFDAGSGATIDAAFVSGLNTPYSLALLAIPEPSSLALNTSGLVVLTLAGRRRIGRRS